MALRLEGHFAQHVIRLAKEIDAISASDAIDHAVTVLSARIRDPSHVLIPTESRKYLKALRQ